MKYMLMNFVAIIYGPNESYEKRDRVCPHKRVREEDKLL